MPTLYLTHTRACAAGLAAIRLGRATAYDVRRKVIRERDGTVSLGWAVKLIGRHGAIGFITAA